MCSNSSMKLAMKRNRELSAIWRGKSKVTNSFGYFTLIASSTARWDYSTVYNRQGKGHFCYKWINSDDENYFATRNFQWNLVNFYSSRAIGHVQWSPKLYCKNMIKLWEYYPRGEYQAVSRINDLRLLSRFGMVRIWN